ncbi:hypothetical protein CPB83DRAFT_896384 [Crepidotus variabilis]|uniref:Uncharacterized protein n=1 Tax=Crepidotus variabilis TaxID=179855 RepID=A0A9P6EBB2_9AGAR|nr:hypothetical protein CPB83DRAFT_896384 [Crepidotus variabilis]
MSVQRTDDDDALVWTAMLRFLVKPRTQEEMMILIDQLGDTSACPCSKTEDTGVIFPKEKVVISLHYLKGAGRDVASSYFIIGHFPPSTWKTTPPENRLNRAPPARGSSESAASFKSQTSKQFPLITELENSPAKTLGVILILVMMDMLSYTTRTRASLPLYKGDQLWPYSP